MVSFSFLGVPLRCALTGDAQSSFQAEMVAMMKAVLPGMRERRRGHIVNITSMGGFITMPGISFYCGSKFALEGISEALGKEVAPFGIHVTALAPGQLVRITMALKVKGGSSLCPSLV